MSSHHEENHSNEKKPVAFTVPFILAVVTLITVVLFLSLCDPKPHHEGTHEEHGTEAAHHEAAAEHHEAAAPQEAAKVEHTDSMTVESTAPSAEAQPAH